MESSILTEQALDYLRPSELSYTEWTTVGMALKESGFPCQLWDDWSRRDGARYHAGECARKWSTFRGTSEPVTAGTIVQMAKDRGWKPVQEVFDWTDEIFYDEAPKIVNTEWMETSEIRPPPDWNPVNQICDYLQALFLPNDRIGYVMQAWRDDAGKVHPADKGRWDRTRDELITALLNCNGDIGSVMGDVSRDSDGLPMGAWIRFNPLDGNGAKNENVTEFRYALVESDTIEIEKQSAIIRELELPVAAVVHSGGKSVHAIVKIGAATYEEYKRRVNYLYEVCQKNGLKIDTQNRNPSRLTRLPGIERGNAKQFLISTNGGKENFEEWKEWIEGLNDDLPELQNLADIWNCMPELTPPLIDGVLRRGHKMLVSGPSKAGKSYALIELSIAIAEGRPWLNFLCSRGRVLYVNLELDRASCFHRFQEVYQAHGWEPMHLKDIDIWNLRGKAKPMNALAAPLIRRARKNEYAAIIIDPIYKVITGDENAADKMAEFCNYFDKVCTEIQSAVIYCHHHSKGAQGGKRSMDRASGSGVFARDPDALLDLLELTVPKEYTEDKVNEAICAECRRELEKVGLLEKVPVEERNTGSSLMNRCESLIPEVRFRSLENRCAALQRKIESRTAFRIEATLREFAPFKPVNIWFDHPIHTVDDVGILDDASPAEEATFTGRRNRYDNRKNLEKRKTGAEKEMEMVETIEKNFDFMAGTGNTVAAVDLANSMNISTRTLFKYLEKCAKLGTTAKSEKGTIYRK